MSKDKDNKISDKAKAAGLSTEEIAKIESDVAKELEKELKDKAAADYKATLLAKARKAAVETPKEGEELQAIFIELPPNSDRITLDGKIYVHGKTYHVTHAVLETLSEVMSRGWAHEDEVKGRRDSNAGRNKRNTRI